ncbi:MAG: Uma2 family endonuclease, partial [Dehalococcoidia bacterium]
GEERVMPISEATYELVALEDREGKWELHCGYLRSKPAMTARHNEIAWVLGVSIQNQLGRKEYTVRLDAGRTRRPGATFFIPDVVVIPRALFSLQLQERPTALEIYSDPLPLVVEVWSPSTGDYVVDEKLIEYQRRGDLEIWRIHPYERTLTAWQRQPDGSYSKTLFEGGTVRPASLSGVTIDLDDLLSL